MVYGFEPSNRERDLALEKRKRKKLNDSIAERLLKDRVANSGCSLSKVLNGASMIVNDGSASQ